MLTFNISRKSELDNIQNEREMFIRCEMNIHLENMDIDSDVVQKITNYEINELKFIKCDINLSNPVSNKITCKTLNICEDCTVQLNDAMLEFMKSVTCKICMPVFSDPNTTNLKNFTQQHINELELFGCVSMHGTYPSLKSLVLHSYNNTCIYTSNTKPKHLKFEGKKLSVLTCDILDKIESITMTVTGIESILSCLRSRELNSVELTGLYSSQTMQVKCKHMIINCNPIHMHEVYMLAASTRSLEIHSDVIGNNALQKHFNTLIVKSNISFDNVSADYLEIHANMSNGIIDLSKNSQNLKKICIMLSKNLNRILIIPNSSQVYDYLTITSENAIQCIDIKSQIKCKRFFSNLKYNSNQVLFVSHP